MVPVLQPLAGHLDGFHTTSISELTLCFGNGEIELLFFFFSFLFMSAKDFGLYGSRTSMIGPSSSSDRSPPEESTPPLSSRSWSLRKYGDGQVLPSELSHGLLDLHTFDTELLPEVWPLNKDFAFKRLFFVIAKCNYLGLCSWSYSKLRV